jgi:hypothetical protein
MGSRVVIHCEPGIAWQPRRASHFVEGFRRKGIACEVTDSRTRIDDCPAVLLGTTCWRGIERDGGEFLLVDRCSFGDTEKFVSLVWNGHGRRGDHRVPENFSGERWERYGVELRPINREPATRVVLCGQTETYSPNYASVADWYNSLGLWPSHFRKHPSGENPTGLPDAGAFRPTDIAVTLNSSIGVQCVLNGIATVTMDEGAMAYPVTGHAKNMACIGEREPWCHWLAWTQFTDDEIREGLMWDWQL